MSVRAMNNHMWTKENVKALLALWDTKNMREIAEQLNLTQAQVNYMASNLRKKGFPLAQKRQVGQLQILLDEVAGEMGITITK